MFKTMNINRERGSLTDPCAMSNRITGVHTHCNGATTPVDYYRTTAYRYFADFYETYGIGVWGYKPCFSAKIYQEFSKMPDDPVCPRGIKTARGPFPFHSGYYWSNDGSHHPDAVTLPVEFRIQLTNKVQARLPSISTGMPDLYVFIREFLDIKTTFEFLKEKALATKVAGAGLSYSFGVRPFIADILKFIENVSAWRNRLQQVKDGIGKVHDLTASVTWTDLNNDDVEVLPCPAQQSSCGSCCFRDHRTNRSFTKIEHTLAQTIKYRYSWPAEADVMSNSVLAFLTANNILPSRGSAWELIPFSFVLDWVANTDKWLAPLTENLGFDCMVSIVDTCVTYKIRQSQQKSTYVGYTNCFGQTLDCDTVEDYFYRWTGEDALDRLDWSFKLPTMMQFLLGGALVECLRH